MRNVFEGQLEQIDAQLLVMGSAIEDALRAALAALESRDAAAAREVAGGDDEIDRMERDIEGLCLRVMLTQQPVAGDLRLVSGALRMVGDMERIGDQAADIAAIAAQAAGAPDARIAADLAAMGERTCAMVHAAVASFVSRDAAAAREVAGMDAAVDRGFARLRAEVACAVRAGEGDAEALVDALMVAKYLERIGDHAENIAEWVEYSVTGIYKGTAIG